MSSGERECSGVALGNPRPRPPLKRSEPGLSDTEAASLAVTEGWHSKVTPMATSKPKCGTVSYTALPSERPAKASAGNRVFASISAKFSGPGPGKYSRNPCTGIKDHDFTKYAEPAYTMRVKSSERMISIMESPGPCYFVDPSLSHLGIWRPISFRMMTEKKRKSPVPTPAPNEYYVEKIHPIDESNAPAYTIGRRTRYWESSPHPGPSRYALPRTLGPRLPVNVSAPCLSMASGASTWSYAKDLVKGPGPAMHTIPELDVYLHHQPAYSMSQRLLPSRKDYTPGPPDYNADRVSIHKPRAPRFSLGIRHSDYITSTPTMCLIKD